MPSTITVKKSNGQLVSKPLEEIKKLHQKGEVSSSVNSNSPSAIPSSSKKQSQKTSSAPVLPARVPAAGLPQKITPPKAVVTPSVSPASPSSSVSSKLTAQDFSSPLEEPIDPAKVSVTNQKSFADHHVMDVLSRLSFTVPEEFTNRLITITELCIKQVRTDDQTREVCLKPVAEGGLGLNTKKAEELIKVCHEELKKMHPEYGINLPATTTPVNPFKHPTSSAPSTSSTPHPSPLLTRKISSSETAGTTPILESSRPAVHRPVMNDVTYRPVALGPIEELRSSTLTDIRRLAPITTDAFARFGQKFVNLKNESVILFFQAVDAYHAGVLFKEYTDLLTHALAQKKPLYNFLTNQEVFQQAELHELVMTEERLGI